jgi:FAD/FMN-containing dehydrogenase
MLDQAASPRAEDVLSRIAGLTDAETIVPADQTEALFTDVYRRREAPLAVLRPASVEALQAVVREAASAGLTICPRGGGASYTDAYLPIRPDSLLIDTGRLNRIVEVNAADGYVTVEAGVTWAALKEALDPLGLRTPFFGPFSGLAATIGGSVSQNATSHGSATHGISAQSVLALDVVIASGELLRTGSGARGAAPFARHFGPDLTGLFTGDCGALGIKARITLPLLRRKPAFQLASFAFANLADLGEAMRDAALERLEDEHFAIDAALAQGQIGRQDTAAVLGMARSVLASSANPIAGLAQLARMAASGTRALKKAQYMLHFILDGVDAAEAKAKLGRLRKVMHLGTEIPNSVPAIVRGLPFAPLFNTLGPKGERWVPLHGILPHSHVGVFHAALEALYAARADEMKRLGVWTGGMFATVGSSGFLYEVAIYWPGPPTPYHQAVLPAAYLAGLPQYPQSDEAAAFVDQLKGDITALFGTFGAVHFQLGKTYPFASVLQPAPLALIRALKAALDPQGIMNPGALGL